MLYSFRQIADILDSTLWNDLPHCEECKISIPLSDSRQLGLASQTVFFGLKGKSTDGSSYVSALFSMGVRYFILHEGTIKVEDYPEASFLFVPDTLHALQQLAIHHRRQFDIPILGITGSNGKTIVKEWMYTLYSREHIIHRSPGSYNSQIGVALSVLGLKPQHQFAIIEAGISQRGEMQRLYEMILPTHGLFTNVGTAHEEGFDSLEEKIKEKCLLFQSCQLVVSCADHEPLEEYLRSIGPRHFAWSKHQKENTPLWYALKSSTHTLDVHFADSAPISLALPFQDPASIENLMHVVALGHSLRWRIEVERMYLLSKLDKRLEVIDGNDGNIIVHDAYSFDWTSLTNALHYCDQIRTHKSMMLVITDIDQSKQPQEEFEEHLSALVRRNRIEQVLFVGHHSLEFQEKAPSNWSFVHDTAAAIGYFGDINLRDTLILIKGARRYRLEELTIYLQQKDHDTYLEVNLSALEHNYSNLRSLLPQDTKSLVMIKANAYGGGAQRIASFFEALGVDYFGVAYTDEAVALRSSGVRTPILILNPSRSSFGQILRHKLEPELYSLSILTDFLAFCRSHETRDYPVHLKVDSGMHRLGFELQELDSVAPLLSAYQKEIRVASVFTHLSSTDDIRQEDFTREQVCYYHRFYEKISAVLGYRPIRHVLNSHGIINYPEYAFDMVRMGIGLYGYLSGKLNQPVYLENVLALRTRISQIKHLPPGASIGYNRSTVLTSYARIATVAVGYADGLPRALSNGGYCLACGDHTAPIIGNVCMDMTMIDLTQHPQIADSNELTVFDSKHSLENLAAAAGTIPYEILTRISERIKRIYIRE